MIFFKERTMKGRFTFVLPTPPLKALGYDQSDDTHATKRFPKRYQKVARS